jgi:thiosulfate dehydrogenase (quinone) large subunit
MPTQPPEPKGVLRPHLETTYWSSDQLIAQYPIMGMLSAVVIAWPVLAAHLSATSLIVPALRGRAWAAPLVEGPVRRWL